MFVRERTEDADQDALGVVVSVIGVKRGGHPERGGNLRAGQGARRRARARKRRCRRGEPMGARRGRSRASARARRASPRRARSCRAWKANASRSRFTARAFSAAMTCARAGGARSRGGPIAPDGMTDGGRVAANRGAGARRFEIESACARQRVCRGGSLRARAKSGSPTHSRLSVLMSRANPAAPFGPHAHRTSRRAGRAGAGRRGAHEDLGGDGEQGGQVRALSSRDSTRPVPRISNPARGRFRDVRDDADPRSPYSHPRHRRITKKSEKYFFDRDKVKWVEWEKEAEAFKAVAGERRSRRRCNISPRRVGSSARWIDEGRRDTRDEDASERTSRRCASTSTHAKFHRASLRAGTHRRLRLRGMASIAFARRDGREFRPGTRRGEGARSAQPWVWSRRRRICSRSASSDRIRTTERLPDFHTRESSDDSRAPWRAARRRASAAVLSAWAVSLRIDAFAGERGDRVFEPRQPSVHVALSSTRSSTALRSRARSVRANASPGSSREGARDSRRRGRRRMAVLSSGQSARAETRARVSSRTRASSSRARRV